MMRGASCCSASPMCVVPLAGQVYWATPGGGVEEGETYEAAAVRELQEETGLVVEDVGPEIWRQEVIFQTPDGEYRLFEERYFRVRAPHDQVSPRRLDRTGTRGDGRAPLVDSPGPG